MPGRIPAKYGASFLGVGVCDMTIMHIKETSTGVRVLVSGANVLMFSLQPATNCASQLT